MKKTQVPIFTRCSLKAHQGYWALAAHALGFTPPVSCGKALVTGDNLFYERDKSVNIDIRREHGLGHLAPFLPECLSGLRG